MTTRLSKGVMTTVINGNTYELAATAAVARHLDRVHGGLTPAFAKVNNHDFGACVSIINVATNRTGTDTDKTEDDVFAEGIVNVAPLVITFLGFLSTGGKAPPAEPEKKDDGADKGTVGKAD